MTSSTWFHSQDSEIADPGQFAVRTVLKEWLPDKIFVFLGRKSTGCILLVYSGNQLIIWVQHVYRRVRDPKKTPVVILVRVSTAKQETNRQVSELAAYAEGKGYEVIEICRETVSGTANGDERHGLRRAQALAHEGKIKKVLVHEISRLARRNSITHQFVEGLEDCQVSLYWHAQGIETLLPNGKRNPAAGIMLALLAEMARSEIETLRGRIKSGLAEARRKGVRLGRPEGTTTSREVFLRKHRDIRRQLRAGQSVRNTAKITGKGASTVQRVKLALEETVA